METLLIRERRKRRKTKREEWEREGGVREKRDGKTSFRLFLW